MSGPSGGQRWPGQRLLSPHSCRSPGAPFSAGARPPPPLPPAPSLARSLSSSLSSLLPALVAPSTDPAAFAAALPLPCCCCGAPLFLSYLKSLYRSKSSALNEIPGPWYASFTAIHLRYLFARGTVWKYAARQHRRYGSVIRLGPRQIWVSDKEALKDILLQVDLPKVTMYAEISRDRNSPGLFGEMSVSFNYSSSLFLTLVQSL